MPPTRPLPLNLMRYPSHLLHVLAVSSASLPLAFGQTTEDFKLLASDGATGDTLGYSVAIAGNFAVAGSYNDDDNGANSGAAYLYDVTTGQEIRKLVAASSNANDHLGRAVGINGDRAVIGSPGDDGEDIGPFLTDSGSVYVFDLQSGAELFRLRPADAFTGYRFGDAISVSGDLAAIGAYGSNEQGTQSGTAYVFDVRTGQELFKLTPEDSASGDRFGEAIGISGSWVVGGAASDDDLGSNAGCAYVFDANTGAELFQLLADDGMPGDRFGAAVAVSGQWAVIGARSHDANGEQSGAAYLFDLSTGLQVHKLLPNDGEANDFFGNSVAISDGRIVVGCARDEVNGNDSGSVYVFDLATGNQIDQLEPTDPDVQDFFGHAVDISGTQIIVGTPFGDDGGAEAGSAYLFEDPGGPGSVYCDPAVTNSTGTFGKISATGSVLASANQFGLLASDLPTGQFAYFIAGTESNLVMGPSGSNGNLCVGGTLVRFNGSTQIGTANPFGIFSLDLDLTQFPANPTATVQAGDRWYFQCWHREPGGQSNFTTATVVTFD